MDNVRLSALQFALHFAMISTHPVSGVPLSEFDVLIVGAGMVGSTLAAALAHTPLRVGLIEARDLSQGVGPDGRASALALGTVWMLDQLGAWPQMQSLGVSPIHQIQVCDGEQVGLCCLDREAIQVEALGYIVENRVTQLGLAEVIAAAPNIQVISPVQVQGFEVNGDRAQVQLWGLEGGSQVSTQLLVAADGGRSPLRGMARIPVWGWDYGQTCLVTTVVTEHPHRQVAYERFQPSGPFAILPMTPVDPLAPSQRSCVVWTIRSTDQDGLMSLSDQDFIEAISGSFGPQLGPIQSVTPRACYVPRRQHSRSYIGSRLALVGDAAHSTHPVGGQGVNMGMRDVAALASLVHQAHQQGQDLGGVELLRRYQQIRRWENWSVLFGTDAANRLFSNTLLPLQWIRRLGLRSLEWMSLPKQALMRQAMGIATYQPRLQLPQIRDNLPIPTVIPTARSEAVL